MQRVYEKEAECPYTKTYTRLTPGDGSKNGGADEREEEEEKEEQKGREAESMRL